MTIIDTNPAEPPEGPDGPPVDPWIGISRVEAEVGLGRSTIYRRMDAGTFPVPRDLGGGVVRWPLSEIRAWKAARPPVEPTRRGASAPEGSPRRPRPRKAERA
ncbi:helix-turn-helix transcriptional regulator [Falsiroseomonas sp. CW058]|uniref:helix-turn-helix transcriptional regulator n=1 Tax=Falsiroseomonas sp. CW058 TaxID=3388664 RepID=UPI003D314F20